MIAGFYFLAQTPNYPKIQDQGNIKVTELKHNADRSINLIKPV